jgi:ribosome-associated translation inhibitor RaiA
MYVKIESRKAEISPTCEEWIERRLHFALGRFGDRIRRAAVRLADLNGPRGGEDQHCRIEVSLVPSGSIMAEATDAEIELAVSRAAERVTRRIRDARDRRRTLRTRTTTPRETDDLA